MGVSSSAHILLTSAATELRKYRIPSDLRSQAQYRLVSTMVGDNMGILSAAVTFCPGFEPSGIFYLFIMHSERVHPDLEKKKIFEKI